MKRCAISPSASTNPRNSAGISPTRVRPRRSGYAFRCLAVTLLLAARVAAAQNAPTTPDPKAFALEALAGSAGSLVGIGIVALSSKCDVEDLRCMILSAGAGGALGALGAALGTTLAARSMNTRRSVPGAALGAVVGTGVGLGVHWLLNAGTDRNIGDKVVLPIFVFSQGIFAVLGSRALGSTPR